MKKNVTDFKLKNQRVIIRCDLNVPMKDGVITDESKTIIDRITNQITETGKKKMSVEEIQDIVETKLMQSSRKDVAKIYILYRNERTKIRDRNSKLIKPSIVNF